MDRLEQSLTVLRQDKRFFSDDICHEILPSAAEVIQWQHSRSGDVAGADDGGGKAVIAEKFQHHIINFAFEIPTGSGGKSAVRGSFVAGNKGQRRVAAGGTAVDVVPQGKSIFMDVGDGILPQTGLPHVGEGWKTITLSTSRGS